MVTAVAMMIKPANLLPIVQPNFHKERLAVAWQSNYRNL
jgi:hypothetical protein